MQIFAVLVVAVAMAVPARNFRGSSLQGKTDNRQQQQQAQSPESETEGSESGDSSSADKVNECRTLLQQAGGSGDAEKSSEGQPENESEEPKETDGGMNAGAGKRNARKF